MPEGKKPAEDLYSAKTHLHQPVPEVSTVNATALPADAPEGALPSEVRPEIVTWEKLCEAIKASGKAYNMEMITKAYDLANKAHNGVCRRSGEPYICHPLAVARLVLDLGMDSESIAAALLHDVVEDTPITLEELEQEFPPAVTDALRLLTHQPGTNYFDYVRAIRSNPVARAVKLADLDHNSDETRLAGCLGGTAQQRERWRKKYGRKRRSPS